MTRAIAWAKMSILIVLASTTATATTAAKYASTATTRATTTKDTSSPYHPVTVATAKQLYPLSYPLIPFLETL